MTPRERLEHLAHSMKLHANELAPVLDMETWADNLPEGATLQDLIKGCGTAACAAGIACLLPALKADGLHLWGSTLPGFGSNTGDEALEEFFGLTTDEMEYIFMPDSYGREGYRVFPEEVVAHIEKVLEGLK